MADCCHRSLGFHNCRYGYKSYVDVADQIVGYAEAGIPLETMWCVIDVLSDITWTQPCIGLILTTCADDGLIEIFSLMEMNRCTVAKSLHLTKTTIQ